MDASRRARARDRRRPRDRVQRLGAGRPCGVGGRRLQLLGRPHPPDARDGPVRRLGAVPPRRRRRRALQVRDPRARRRDPAEGRSARVRDRGAAQDRVGRPRADARMGRRGVAGRAPQVVRARGPDVDLRGPPRLVAAEPARGQPLADLPRDGRRARRVRARHGLHAHRAAAGDGAPVHRLLGLPGDRLLRADAALRLAGRLPRVRRPPAPEGARRDPRLGAGPLPARRLRARPLRRHRAVRARGPAPRRAPRLGHAGLQLRPPRGPQLPRRQRPVLAARVPRRRHPGRRGRVDAVPGLLPRGGPVGAEPVRRQRGPRRGRLPEGAQRGRRTAASRA